MKMKYETALAKLQDIVDKLENGNLSLDESLKLYKEGTKLSAFCYDYLKNAEQEITTINVNDDEDNDNDDDD